MCAVQSQTVQTRLRAVPLSFLQAGPLVWGPVHVWHRCADDLPSPWRLPEGAHAQLKWGGARGSSSGSSDRGHQGAWCCVRRNHESRPNARSRVITTAPSEGQHKQRTRQGGLAKALCVVSRPPAEGPYATRTNLKPPPLTPAAAHAPQSPRRKQAASPNPNRPNATVCSRVVSSKRRTRCVWEVCCLLGRAGKDVAIVMPSQPDAAAVRHPRGTAAGSDRERQKKQRSITRGLTSTTSTVTCRGLPHRQGLPQLWLRHQQREEASLPLRPALERHETRQKCTHAWASAPAGSSTPLPPMRVREGRGSVQKRT